MEKKAFHDSVRLDSEYWKNISKLIEGGKWALFGVLGGNST